MELEEIGHNGNKEFLYFKKRRKKIENYHNIETGIKEQISK